VDADPDRSLLRLAVEGHKENHHVDELMQGVVYRDDPMEIIGKTFDDMLVYPKRAVIEETGVPLDIWGSWMDANTADTVIRHFTTFKNPVRGVISAWSHGGGSFHSPYAPPGTPLEIPRPNQLYEILRLMDQHFHGIDSHLPERILFYYTMGEETWKSTTVWPLPNTRKRIWHLDNAHTLSKHAAEEGGKDDYQVDFEVTTGEQNRWWTEMGGGPITYGDRAEPDHKLLVYNSTPLEEDTEITGYPVVNLYVTSTEEDGAFFVYLEDIDPEGKVTYITEGMLRAMHRKVSTEEPPYKVFGPYHTYQRMDGAPLVPGEVAELRFALMPTSVLIRKGHRIRLAIACADKDTFQRVPDSGDPAIQVHFGGNFASSLELPVVPRDSFPLA
jgi:putative CocE/NonD family hydrolase